MVETVAPAQVDFVQHRTHALRSDSVVNKVLLPNLFLKSCSVLFVANTIFMTQSVPQAYAQHNSLSTIEQKTGWKLLFDGKTTSGWRNFRKDDIGSGWMVKDEALVRMSSGAGDIVTIDQYDSFELSIEYKISKAGNSGIMFHVTEESDSPWKTGPEIQIQDNVDGHDPQKSGWLYQLYEPSADAFTKIVPDSTRPVGQWNQVILRVTPDVCETNVNGIRYAIFKKGSKDWEKRVSQSKFSQYPSFGKATKGHVSLQDHGDEVAYRNIKIRELHQDGTVASNEVESILAVGYEEAFPGVRWSGYEAIDLDGKPQSFRPIVLTHADDGSGRIFVATQQGVIHVLDPADRMKVSKVFADLTSKVTYKDNENEEGLLGVAFHPEFKDNGTLFVYYTSAQKDQHTSVIARFRVSAENPNQIDAAFEEEILVIPQPFWNHNGGTLCFDSEGYLCIGLGDGGAGNDPIGNAQNLETLLGKILRIDIDHKDNGINYAIPKDNPFVGCDGVRPEIYASGFRNVWRMALDRKTGKLWAADVGQNLYEEINLITKGGNYGWNLREGAHPFGAKQPAEPETLIDPIFEYDHRVGASITGGLVYRGTKVPELEGKYLYADYVSGKLFALHYDEKSRQIISHQSISSPKLPVISYGDDESGEVYFMVISGDGQGIYRFASQIKNRDPVTSSSTRE